MNQCKFYHIYEQHSSHRDAVTGISTLVKTPVGTCWGTKNHEVCSCSGNRLMCERAQKEQTLKDLSKRITDLIPLIRDLDLSGFIEDEASRSDIIAELLDIGKELEKR